MSKNYGLGRGLASLIPQKKADEGTVVSQQAAPFSPTRPEEPAVPREGAEEVEVEKIVANPYQPRLTFDEEKLKELSESIKKHGVIQPLIVSRIDTGFELIAGERRLQASKLAGLKKVPVVVRSAGDKDKLELAIIENVQRHDLDSIEEAKAYARLMEEYQLSQEEVAEKIGKNRSTIANKVRLLQLPVEIQRALIEGKISEGHCKVILAVANPEKQRALFELILKNNLTVRQIENKVKEVTVNAHTRVAVNTDPEAKALEDKLASFFGTKVKLQKAGGEGGKIVVEFYSKEELDGIIGKIVS